MQFIVDFFYIGGTLAMSTISISGIVMLITLVMSVAKIKIGNLTPTKSLEMANELAILSVVMGIFFQLIGLYSAFVAIESMGSISMGMLAGGIKVSMHSTLYGFFFFLIGKIAIITIRFRSTEV